MYHFVPSSVKVDLMQRVKSFKQFFETIPLLSLWHHLLIRVNELLIFGS